MEQVCPSCKIPLQPAWYFCPNCNKKLKEKPISVSIPKQIGIYVASIFLPPMGLMWGIPYLKNPNKKTKIIGIITLVLTVISIVVSIMLFQQIMNAVSQSLNNELNNYQIPSL